MKLIKSVSAAKQISNVSGDKKVGSIYKDACELINQRLRLLSEKAIDFEFDNSKSEPMINCSFSDTNIMYAVRNDDLYCEIEIDMGNSPITALFIGEYPKFIRTDLQKIEKSIALLANADGFESFSA